MWVTVPTRAVVVHRFKKSEQRAIFTLGTHRQPCYCVASGIRQRGPLTSAAFPFTAYANMPIFNNKQDTRSRQDTISIKGW